MRYYVIDTNVILDNFDSLKDLDGNILIPQIVLEELNHLKDNVREHRGYLQRKALQKLYMFLHSDPTKLKFIHNIKKNINKRFDEHINDNILLNTIIELQSEDAENTYILYTNDIALIMKSHMFNIPVETNIKFIDVDKLNKAQFRKIIVSPDKFEQLAQLIETNRYTNEPIYINKFDFNIELQPYNKYFYIVDEEDENDYYLFRNETHDTQKFVSIEKLLKQYAPSSQYTALDMKVIKPKDDEQLQFMDSLFSNDNIIQSLQISGTGKTLLQLFYAITEILKYRVNQQNIYNKIIFIVNNSTLSRKEIGFLPGSKHEKILPYMSGIADNLQYLFNDNIPDEFNIMKTDFTDVFEIRPISFIRGSSINNAIVIVDEVQNLTWHEIKTVITRINTSTSKLILLGDIYQVDENMSIDYLGIMKTIDLLFNSGYEKFTYLTLKQSYRNEIVNIIGEFNV